MQLRARLVALLLLIPTTLFAQPLADRVPSDAILYFGWQGSTKLGPAYEQSHLKGFLDSSNLPQLFSHLLPAAINRLAQEDKDAAERVRIISTLAAPLWKYPTAIFFSGVDLANPGGPMPKFGFICSAGSDTDTLLAQVNGLLAQAGPAPFPIKALKDGDSLVITVGYAQGKDALGTPASSVASNDRFKTAIAQVQKEPLCVLYVDAEGILQNVDQMIALFSDKETQAIWPKVREAVGLSGLKRIIATSGFDGKEWSTQYFVHAPAPRTGILALLEGKPASEDLLRSIPVSATWMCTGQFSFAKLISEARNSLGKIDLQLQQFFDQGLGGAQMMLGVNIQRDFFEALGDEWAFYIDPSSGGKGFLGFTLVNRLAKPVEFEKAFTKLELAAHNMINAQLAQERMRVGFETMKIDGATVHYVSLPFVSPCWTVRDGNLVAALYPQVVAGALTHSSSKGKSILDNESFLAVRKRLGGDKASGLSFADLPRTADEGYPQILMFSQVGLGFADLFGIKTPPMVIPPLAKLKQHLSPSGSISWTDDLGWHRKAITPFPGASIVASEQSAAALGVAAIGAGVALPAMSKAKESATRVRCASNLRQIGQGVMLYAADHKGNYPADLGILVTTVDAHPSVFLCPTGGQEFPANLANTKPDEQAAWVRQNADYIYVGAKLNSNSPGDAILAYERFENHQHQGINILFNDGHVEFVNMPRATRLIRSLEEAKGNRL